MAGLTYLEVLIATLLIVITLVPALEAMAPGVTGAALHEDRVEDHHLVYGRLEELLAAPFADLDAAATAAGGPGTPSSYSDTLTQADGRPVTRNVYLSRYDADNADGDNDPFTGTEPDLLWLRVEIAGSRQAIETLRADHE